MKKTENNLPQGAELYLNIIDNLIKQFKQNIANVWTKTPYTNRFMDSVLEFSIVESNNRINLVEGLLAETKQPLSQIRELAGSKNQLYVNASTRIAKLAFKTIEGIAQKSQNDPGVAGFLQDNQEFRELMKRCYNVVGIIDNMDVSINFSYYYKQDREIVRKVCVKSGIIIDSGGVGGGHCAITLFVILGSIALSICCLIMHRIT